MKEDEIERMERLTAELERLSALEKSGEISSADQARLDRLRKQAGMEMKIQLWSMGIGLIAIVGFAVWMFSGSEEPEEDVVESPPNYRYGAIGSCQEFVKRRLKSPSSADFIRRGRTATNLGNGEWSVSGMLDAQNSFGAQIRENYRCRVRIDDEENWHLVEVKVGT